MTKIQVRIVLPPHWGKLIWIALQYGPNVLRDIKPRRLLPRRDRMRDP